MKILRVIFRFIVYAGILLYASLLLLSSLPVVQRRIARQVEIFLCNELGTRVQIGNVDVSMFGYAQIDSLLLEDRMGYPMLFASRVSAKVSLMGLLDRSVLLEHAQLYGMRAALRQEHPDSAWNFQFVIDALSSDEKKGDNPWTVNIKSIMVRRGVITVDRLHEPHRQEGFDASHIVLRHVMLDGEIDRIKGDTIQFSISRLSLAEQCGLRITDFDASFEKKGNNIALPECVLRLPHSVIDLSGKWQDGRWAVDARNIYLDSEDFVPIDNRIAGRGAVSLALQAEGDTAACSVTSFELQHDAVRLSTNADITFSPVNVAARDIHASVNVPLLCDVIGNGISLPAFCAADGYSLGFDGNAVYSKEHSAVEGALVSPHGSMLLDADVRDNDLFSLNLSTPEFDLSPFAASLGNVMLTLQSEGSIRRRNFKASANVPLLTAGGYTYHDIQLAASMADSLKIDLNVNDHNASGRLKAVGNLDERSLALDARIRRICPDALDGKLLPDTVGYGGHLLADVVVPQNPLRSYGRIELQRPSMGGSLLADSLVVTATADSMQHISVSSSFMEASLVTRDLEQLVKHRRDNALKATVRLWDDMPLDSLFGIHLSLLDTLRIDAAGRNDELVAQMGFDSGMEHDELHVSATAGYVRDSLWLDLALHSPEGRGGNGRVQASAVLRDSTGLSNVQGKVHNLSVGYVMNLVNFHSVEFDGWASGDVEMLDREGHPFISSLLDIRDFTMNDAYMGGIDLCLTFDTEEKRIGIDAIITDPPAGHFTHAYGQVTPGHRPNSGMDLRVNTRRINAAFVNSFTRGIFEDIEGRVSGDARIYGKFSKIDLYGDLGVDTMSCRVPMLGTGFQSRGDSLLLRPGAFVFPNFHINDGRGGTAVVNGELRHNHFDDINYDFDINAERLLGYHFDTFTDMPFYATAIATGNVTIKGEPGKLDVDIRCRPESGTVLVYDSYSPMAATNADFITYASIVSDVESEETIEPEEDEQESTINMNLHFDLDVNSDARLKVITDAVTGDALDLYGDGRITADYYNKGAFRMYGRYVVDHGLYNLSVQGLITKKFDFRRGGSLTFSGPPLKGDLNLQAVYPVHGVSLNDLSSRATFNSSSVRVDCIMNLGGKCEAPQVTFDFDLHNVNEDEKQMVRSLISTDEERNMQVLYLLGIGRFYSYDYQGGAGQGNNAVKSLLSSTLSSTINNVIGNALGTRNWSFGTSIATGDIGWSDMDIEGLISGRLFNNRLLLNGQFGYRDRTTTGSNFIGDFDLQWILTNNGNVSLKAYSETNDRYFTKSSLTTQGIGLILKKDFDNLPQLLQRKNKKTKRDK